MSEHSGPPPLDWGRLGAAVKARRKEQRLMQEELVARGGPSAKTIAAIEAGRPGPYRPSTFSKLDRALAWHDGATEKILAGTTAPVPAVVPPPPGMTADALAAYVDEFIRAATSRVTGVGADQYDQGDGQRFEGMPLAELLDWTSEELQDVAVYAAMLDIRIRRIKAELERRGAA